MILVVSYPGDEHTEEVVARLARAGREVARIDLADFPSRAGLALGYGDGVEPSYRVELDGLGEVDLAACRAGWWRRVQPFQADPAVTVAHERAFALSETAQAMNGMIDALGCAWVNPPRADEAAHRKPWQWAAAREEGLHLPRTLVTNRPERAREFVRALGPRRSVFKAFLASELAWRETRLVREADLERLDAVRLAPVIFQEFVPGVDLRVTIVGERVFAAEIDATGTAYPVDMRMVVGEARVRPAVLPGEVERALLRLMRRLGLVYGAVDLRRRPDGEHVFLEVNPAGQWLFVERLTALPISDALAETLARLDAPPRPSRGVASRRAGSLPARWSRS